MAEINQNVLKTILQIRDTVVNFLNEAKESQFATYGNKSIISRVFKEKANVVVETVLKLNLPNDIREIFQEIKDSFLLISDYVSTNKIKPSEIPRTVRSLEGKLLEKLNSSLSALEKSVKESPSNKNLMAIEKSLLPSSIEDGFSMIKLSVCPVLNFSDKAIYNKFKRAGFDVIEENFYPILVGERVLVVDKSDVDGDDIADHVFSILEVINSRLSRKFELVSKEYNLNPKNKNLLLFWIVPKSSYEYLRRNRIFIKKWGFPWNL